MNRYIRILLLLPLLGLPACLGDPNPTAPTLVGGTATVAATIAATAAATPPTGTAAILASDTPAPPATAAVSDIPASPTAPTPSATTGPVSDTPAQAPSSAVPSDTPMPPTDIPVTDTPAPLPATTTPRATAPPPPAAIARPAATLPPTARPTTRPASAHAQTLVLLTTGFGKPDDLTVDPRTGAIYFGDFTNNAVNRLDPAGGAPQPVVTGLHEPEGIAVRPDGQLVIVEQATNRLWLGDPQTGAKTLLRQLVNTTGQDGVDGIAFDTDGRILVPDSPNGRVLSLAADGSDLRVLATGFRRPTGAVRLPDGDLLVADEFGNALDRVTPSGHSSLVASLYQPDDVVLGPDGMAYLPTLNGSIYQVNPQTGTKVALITGLILPHGIGIDGQGRVVGAEQGRNRIFRLEP